jgi:transcriptional regulator with XRE-family HTH domain
MPTVDDYLDRAKDAAGINSDRALSQALGVSHGSVSQIRTKRAWPSDELMIRLADLAGMDRGQALLDLNIWRSDGVARSIYKRLARAVAAALLVYALAFSGQPNPAQAASYSATTSAHVQPNTIRYRRFRTRVRTVTYGLLLNVLETIKRIVTLRHYRLNPP